MFQTVETTNNKLGQDMKEVVTSPQVSSRSWLLEER